MRQLGRRGRGAILVASAGTLAVLTCTGFFLAASEARSQSARDNQPTVRMSAVIVAEPEVATPIAIVVGPTASVPTRSYLRIRGVPISAKLSEGHIITPGSWAIPLTALPSLKITAPVSGSGRTELSVALVHVDGGVLAETKASLVVAPAWLLGSGKAGKPAVAAGGSELMAAVPAPRPANRVGHGGNPALAALPPAPTPGRSSDTPPPAPPSTAPPEPPARSDRTPAQPPQISAEDLARAEAMVKRGDQFLQQGNIAVARQFFRRAADMGLAVGALRLGSTYDPVELHAIKVAGLEGDPKEARVWYERARALGAPEAASRISRLEGRR
jgi:hypothetical protein